MDAAQVLPTRKTAVKAAVRKWGTFRDFSPNDSIEPSRDWCILGVITGHRVRTITYMVVFTSLLYWMQGLLWPLARQPTSVAGNIWSWTSLIWCAAAVPILLGLVGMLMYRFPTKLDEVQRIPQFVSWRIVSRGQNIEALISTIRRCQAEMARNPFFDYVIEAVIDEGVQFELLPQDEDVEYFIVPEGYVTENGSLFKARALQYALETSELPETAWIVHLDEETQPTSSGIKGICRMIHEEEESGRLRVGQGAILYHRDWQKHPILALADMVRTGDDFARFYLQHTIGQTIFGLHGSYIVVRNDVEKQAGFDFGPHGSITEDAFWALVLMEAGVRARWCEGYLEEQSTHSLHDFLKQRARWYRGLKLVARYAPVKLRWRFCLGLNTLLWSLSPWAALYTVVHLWHGYQVREEIQLIANLSFAFFLCLYLTGLKVNMDESGIRNPLTRFGMSLAQIVLLPLFSLFEGAGVIYGSFKRNLAFDVVNK